MTEAERPRVSSSLAAGLIALVMGVFVIDAVLAWVPASAGPPSTRVEASQLRQVLRAAADEAQSARTLLLMGDAVLSGEALADPRPDDWAEHRVGAYMRRELATHADTHIHELSFAELTASDALRLLAELDRVDPNAGVELVLELDLGVFSSRHAELEGCTRAAVCELGTERGLGVRGLVDSANWLSSYVPLWRHLERLRERDASNPDTQAAREAEEDFASAQTTGEHAQLRALEAVLDRLDASGRRATLFLTPVRDDFVERTLAPGSLGRHYSALASVVNDHANPRVQIIDLDHPLFGAGHFVDHIHLQPDGARLLALNLLHELGLPLAQRPFEWTMVHPEGFDRSLVHRVSRGAGEGGAWLAEFDRPEGVAVDREGTRVVIADTHNHVLRELRGSMQVVETVAGQHGQVGERDGLALDEAVLAYPRKPELRGDAVWFIDGEARERVRVHADGAVHTPSWRGPACEGYRLLRARPEAIWMLCEDSRLLRLDPEQGEAQQLSHVSMRELVSFDLGPDQVYFADIAGSLWARALEHPEGVESRLRLGKWKVLFRNATSESTDRAVLPNGRRVGYPYHYNDIRLAKVLDLRFVERYGGLLVADEFPPGHPLGAFESEWTERVQLRYFDLDAKRVLPWIKALAHGEAHAVFNESVGQYSSYWHLGSMALAQADCSLVWLERERSRLLRVADGLLGVGKSANHHTNLITIPRLQTLASVSRKVESQLRPDRYLDRRHEPLARRGPFVGLVLGSSLSSMSDRYSNYSLGRRIELELQRELGYRDGIRLDMFQVSWPASTFGENINNFNNWMSTSVPPDLLLIEAHDFGGSYLNDTKEPADVAKAFASLQRLADRYGTFVAFYDISSIESNRRDGMRATDKRTARLLAKAKKLGFTVLDPGDELLARHLTHSPWGCQPFANNQHHGSSWAIEMTAQVLVAKLAPLLRERLAGRDPVRWSERDPESFERKRGKPLRLALDQVNLDEVELMTVEAAYVQTNFIDGELFVYVDLAGFGDALAEQRVEELALSAIASVLSKDIYAELATRTSIELVEFSNYDEYGNGVLDSANTLWRRSFDHATLGEFLVEQVAALEAR